MPASVSHRVLRPGRVCIVSLTPCGASLCRRHRGQEKAFERFSGSVVIPASAVLGCLIPGSGRSGRTGAVTFYQSCRMESVPSKPSPLSTCIDKSPVGGPQAQDDTHRCTTRWAQGDTRWRGYDPHRRAIAGRYLPDHLPDGVGMDGRAGVHKAEVTNFHAAIG